MNQTLHKWKRRVGRKVRLPKRKISFGDLARTSPWCRNYGFSRGKPVDRFYIEQFMENNRVSVKGRVLELLNNRYTRKYGGENVTVSEVLDINPDNGKATIHDDLRTLSSIDDASFDCIILTQTLHLIDDDGGALRQLYRVLAPGGTLLMTVPCISRVPKTEEDGMWNRFYTDHGVAYLLKTWFEPCDFTVELFGNLPAATAFLYGLAVEDLEPSLFRVHDPEFPLIIGTCATKANIRDVSAQTDFSAISA